MIEANGKLTVGVDQQEETAAKSMALASRAPYLLSCFPQLALWAKRISPASLA